MSLDDLLTATKRANIRLEVEGNDLCVDAQVGTLTADLRDQLARHKPALLALLAPTTEFIALKNGPALPAPVLRLAWDLEARGFQMALDHDQQARIDPTPISGPLTDADRAAISRWRLHLAALLAYRAPAPEWLQ